MPDPNYPQFLPPNYDPSQDPNGWLNLGYSQGDLSNAGLETQPIPNLGASPFEQFARDRMNAPGAALQVNQRNVAQDNAAQTELLQYLHQMARGDPNSAAQRQLGASAQRAQAGALSGAAGVEGVGAGRARRTAAVAQEGVQSRLAGQRKLLQLQQQRQAQQLLAQLYAQLHGQDVGMAGQLAGLGLQNTGQNDTMQQSYTGANNAGFINRLQQGQDLSRAQNDMDLTAQQLDRASAQRWVGAGAAAAGTAAQALQRPPQESRGNWGTDQLADNPYRGASQGGSDPSEWRPWGGG